MRFLSHLAIAACALFLVQGLYVVRLNPRSARNLSFFALCLLFAHWDFCYAFLHYAPDEQHFWFWLRLATPAWMLFPPVALEFLLRLTSREAWLRPWVLRMAVYCPALVFWYAGADGHMLTASVTPHAWGWVEHPPRGSVWAWAYMTYYWGCVLVGVAQCFRLAREAARKRDRRQALIVACSASGTLLSVTTMEFVLPSLGLISIPSTGSTLMLIWGVGTAFAIGRYRMLRLTPSLAADHIVERMIDAMLLIDPQGHVVEVNERTRALLEKSEEELRGAPLHALGALPETIRGAVDHALADDSAECDTDLVATSGDRIPMHLSLSCVRDGGAETIGAVVIGRDLRQTRRLEHEVETRKKAEQEAAAMQTAMLRSQKLQAIGQLAGGIAHDFNNQLASILGCAELAYEAADGNADAQAELREVIASAKRARRLTSQLLAFARKQVIQPHGIDLNELISSMTRMLKAAVGAHIRLEHRLSSVPVLVLADETQIERVILNLVFNARDAMVGGGTVAIETCYVRLDGSPGPAPPGLTPGEYGALRIVDSGAGMTPDVLARIFEPFYTTKELGRGTGLGLATVYGIVEQHRGAIWATSKPAEGSVFTVILPRAPRASRRSSPAPPARLQGGTETILLVDDDPAVRAMVSRTLSRRGYRVIEASCGEEAMNTGREHEGPIDLLLTDAVMPGLSWEQLCGDLRRQRPSVHLLLMSGQSGAPEGEAAQLGSIQFLQKPFSVHQLLSRVRGALDS